MNGHVDTYKNKGARKKLVTELSAKGIIDDGVLAAINNIPRHFFFDKTFESHAYEDKAFPIGEGQTISQPYTVAYQTQLLHIHPGDKVLEIGTGSGYQCSILAEMGAIVFTIERHEKLMIKANKLLTELGYTNVHFKCGDGTTGWPEHATFDKIIVTAGAPEIPKLLAAQLAIGGIMVIPVGDKNIQQMITLVRKSDKKFERIVYDQFKFVPLIGEEGW